MTIRIVCVGNLKEDYLRSAAAEYIKRLSRFCVCEVIETAELSIEKEKALIEKHLTGKVVALCIEGRKQSSQQFAEFIEKSALTTSKLTFVIGGSDGLSEEIKQKADFKLSFSDMTFPHQLMRIMLLEQIYRAETIINNIKYHK